MPKTPRRRRADGVFPFHGGPRDGDRILVEGETTIFDVPILFDTPKGEPDRDLYARYELRGGAYHYMGQTERLRGDDAGARRHD